MTARPRIVCLCGSTRFKDQINATNARLTLEGTLVISLGVFGHTDMPGHDWTTGGSDLKRTLDDLHKRKIDLADEILVVSDESGYFGDSTIGEIWYAVKHGKRVSFDVPAARKRAVDLGLIAAGAVAVGYGGRGQPYTREDEAALRAELAEGARDDLKVASEAGEQP